MCFLSYHVQISTQFWHKFILATLFPLSYLQHLCPTSCTSAAIYSHPQRQRFIDLSYTTVYVPTFCTSAAIYSHPQRQRFIDLYTPMYIWLHLWIIESIFWLFICYKLSDSSWLTSRTICDTNHAWALQIMLSIYIVDIEFFRNILCMHIKFHSNFSQQIWNFWRSSCVPVIWKIWCRYCLLILSWNWW